MNFKCSYTDFVDLSNYLTKKAEGSPLDLSLSLEGNLVIKAVDKNGDVVSITIFPEELNCFPKINKTYRLSEETQKKNE